MKIIKLIYIVIFIIISCKEPEPKPNKYGCYSKWVEPPTQVAYIAFKTNKTLLKLFSLDTLKDTVPFTGSRNDILYYKKDNKKVFLGYFYTSRLSQSDSSLSYFGTGEAMSLSWSTNTNIKTFYIDWPNGETDSMFMDFYHDKERMNPECRQFPLRKFTYNGKPFIKNTNHFRNGIYVFDR